MFGVATPSGGLELVGLHVPCSGRGSVFLQPGNALNVLYGRNGAGKTSIIEGVKELVSGTGNTRGAVAVFRLSAVLIENVFELLSLGSPPADATCHNLPPQHARGSAKHRISFWLETFGTLDPPSMARIEEYLDSEMESEEAELYRSTMYPIASLAEVKSGTQREVPLLRLFAAVAAHMIENEPVNPNEDTQESWPLWYLSQLRRALAANLEMPKAMDDVYAAPQGLGSQATMAAFFEEIGLEPPSVDLDELGMGDLRHFDWDDLSRLLVYREVLAATRESYQEWTPGVDLGDAVREVAAAVIGSRMVAISSVGSPGQPMWTVQLVADSSEGPAAIQRVASERPQVGDSSHTPFDFRKVSRYFDVIKKHDATANALWQDFGETYEVLTGEERAELEAIGDQRAKRMMLHAYHLARGMTSEDRAALLAEMRRLAETGFEWGDIEDEQEEEEVAGTEIGQTGENGAAVVERRDAAQAVLRTLVHRTLGGGRYALSDISFSTTAFPWALCDLDECPDPKEALEQDFRRALRSGPLAAGTFVDFSEDLEERLDHQLESRAVSELQSRVERAGNRLAHMGLGVGGLRLRVSADIRDWLDAGPLSFEALDAPSQRWVDVGLLSSAQQRWVARVLHLENNLEGGFPLLVLADEPEAGVHTTAALAVLKLLEGTGVTSLVATHATAAFRLPEANLILVDRDFSGSVVLGSPGTGDDVQVAAVRMGTTPLELLAMKRLLVYVEGAHDEAVAVAVISQSADQGLMDRVIVAPARGVQQFGGVAASVLLTEFTDLHMLVVADNARTEALKAAKAEALELLRDGVDAPTVKRRMRLSERAGGSFEERVLWDLLERCIDRHVLHRMHFHGLTVKDIIETLPSRSLGLNESWPTLRAQYPGLRGEDFKAWLKREKSTSISVRTIRHALSSLDALSDDLVSLLQAIEEADAAARVG